MRLARRLLKSSIFIDEDNAKRHLQHLGIEGFLSWLAFYKMVENILKENFGSSMKTEFNFYGALPPKDMEKMYSMRHRFFSKLGYDGIRVSLGECHRLPDGSITQKQVDLLIALDILQYSMYKYDYIILFSSDADFVPALQRARNNGSHTIAIMSKKSPAFFTKKHINEVLYLEDIILKMDNKTFIYTNKTQLDEIN
ncbi:NYN domain-containing protein [Paenibacillus periandrae]|uniref:NYN domain-containing protein n=1 Tax=Paenibacillus periandrae TaxID=1761741 RepID=UPI001F094E44|nr:NYN domain-containing protein [Paenibacillus periandrae]